MADTPINHGWDDVVEEGVPIDPTQLAVHGLLSVYFELQAGTRASRSDEILARAPTLSLPSHFTLRMPTTRWIIGLAAAAIIAVVVSPWPVSEVQRSLGGIARDFALAVPVPFPMQLFTPEDPEFEQAASSIDQWSVERDEALASGKFDPDPWVPWTQLYRNLLALGRWEEGLAELHAFVDYAAARNNQPERFSMYYTALYDLGNAYTAMGDYPVALEYHLKALDERRDYQIWDLERNGNIDPSSCDFALRMCNTLAPQYWALASVAEAMGDLASADRYLIEAENLLVEYLRAEYQRQDTVLPSLPMGLTGEGDVLAELHARAVALLIVTADGEIDSQLVKVREQFLHRTRWLRLTDRPDDGLHLLDLARQIVPYDRFAYAAETRLDFYEPFEEAYLNLLREDYSAALSAAESAETNTGPRECEGYPPHPQIGAIPRAELLFLKGVVLAGLNHADPRAVRLIDSGLAIINDAATPQLFPARERFLQQFEKWKLVKNQLQMQHGRERS